ncbi:hypothetical protein T484DRAFT_1823444 [Baffinella frigidus]|nr:hypothetical protein T484DRAFT_1823444 [Cryptophyta sp. CCMP2293]
MALALVWLCVSVLLVSPIGRTVLRDATRDASRSMDAGAYFPQEALGQLATAPLEGEAQAAVQWEVNAETLRLADDVPLGGAHDQGALDGEASRSAPEPEPASSSETRVTTPPAVLSAASRPANGILAGQNRAKNLVVGLAQNGDYKTSMPTD